MWRPALFMDALASFRRLGDRWHTAWCLWMVGLWEATDGAPHAALVAYEEALALFRGAGDDWGTAHVLRVLGDLARREGQVERARMLLAESQDLHRRLGDKRGLSINLCSLGGLMQRQRDHTHAAAYYAEALRLSSETADTREQANALLGFGGLAFDEKQVERAARLLGAAATLIAGTRVAPPVAFTGEYAEAIYRMSDADPKGRVARAYAEGQAMDAAAAAADALELARTLAGRPAADSANAPRSPLSGREQEVTALVAEGLTNRQIAERLIISERTADGHVGNILSKLGFSTRAQIAAWCVEQGLRVGA